MWCPNRSFTDRKSLTSRKNTATSSPGRTSSTPSHCGDAGSGAGALGRSSASRSFTSSTERLARPVSASWLASKCMRRSFASCSATARRSSQSDAAAEAKPRSISASSSFHSVGDGSAAQMMPITSPALDTSGTPSSEPMARPAAVARCSGVSSAITSRISTVPFWIRSTIPDRQSAPVSCDVQSGICGPAAKQRRSSPVSRMKANGARSAVAASPTMRSIAAASGP